MAYDVDLRDINFQVFEWLPTAELLRAPRFADWDADSLRMVLREASVIAKEVLSPTNEEGDRTGCSLTDGEVTVPACFKDAYRTLAEGGWIGCINNPELGGMGLPHLAATVTGELFGGANLALSLVTMLTRGAGEVIESFGTPELTALFCEKLYSGEWTGTMCLTEPHAGSDVGASTTRAERTAEGRYLISGEKIFITFGDHDLTDNVVHMVLARLPDAPAGTRGLSLFVVPKLRVAADGSLGEPNDVRCASIEHKMGIHGSPTCSLLFGASGACEGYLLGEENGGMRLMFHLMNTARLEVGLEGVSLAGAAHQAALAYARERLQGRHWSRLADKDAPPVAIVEHPDVRRLLTSSAAYLQAMRALLLRTSYFIDQAAVSEGADAERYGALVELLTPVCKAWGSDWGFRVTEWCLQVFGGYGYTTDYPAEQYLRDAKIASIYEGTNGIQALDLVMRKLPMKQGAVLASLLEEIGEVADRLVDEPRLSGAAEQLGAALAELREVLDVTARRPDAAIVSMLNAVPLLDMVGHTVAGGWLLEQAEVAHRALEAILEANGVEEGDPAAYAALLQGDQEATFYHNKICTAVHFAHRALPQVRALGVAVRAGETTALDAVL